MPSMNEIAILDFGSQYTHLIARRVRELGVVSRIYPNDVKAKKLENAVGIILSGGPRSVVNQPKLNFDKQLFQLSVPVLGLCYGHQLMADLFGGQVQSGAAREYGVAKLKIYSSPIFQNIKKETTVWMSHGDHVDKLPIGFKQIATTGNRSIAAMADDNRKFYGFQFHPEVNHTAQGKIMLNNFVFGICKAQKNWDTATMLKQIQNEIKQQAGNKKVFLLVSGGVDSTVCFALLEKVLGKNRVFGLHVDSGLMRQDETKLVQTALKKAGFDNLHLYNAEAEYLSALKNVFEPEQKRKIIGDLFLKIVDKVMKEKKMDVNDWLIGQGTIYPDTIESGGTKNSDKIKTHHNRVPKILQMIKAGRIIEPIKDLYKDEVRAIGAKLGLPNALITRHPFPGPGLGIRCLCSNTTVDTQTVILSEVEGSMSVYRLPIRSVGVQGDERSYSHPALIVPNKLTDQTWKNFAKLSPRITNSNKSVNRVIFLLSGDKNNIIRSTLSLAFITKPRLELLRQVDAIVNKHVLKDKRCAHIWQLPVVLIPFGYDKKESIVLRPVESEEAMTVSFARIPQDILNKIIDEISTLNVIDYIFYDITNKPPGTIEWE